MTYKEDGESQSRLLCQNHTYTITQSYFLQLLEKVEMVIKRMRWKAIHYSGNEDNDNKMEWYGLKFLSSPIPVEELIPFKNKLISIVKNIKFRKARNDSEDQLQQDLKIMKASSKTLTFSDKVANTIV